MEDKEVVNEEIFFYMKSTLYVIINVYILHSLLFISTWFVYNKSVNIMFMINYELNYS